MLEIQEEDELDIRFDYNFSSFLGCEDEDRYVQNIFVDMVGYNSNGDDIVTVGKATIKMILIEQAINDGYNIFDVFDSDSYTRRIGDMIYDYNECEIKADLKKGLFLELMPRDNICIFERMEILPEYRGYGIGAKFVRDRFHNLSSACCLIVMQPFPLQLEPDELHKCDFERSMHFEDMEHNSQKAMRKLRSYYRSIGYKSVKGYKDLMFLIPDFYNEKLQAIDLNENIEIPCPKSLLKKNKPLYVRG